MIKRQDIVASALRFLHVPFHHQGRSIHGIDCVGLVIEAARGAGVMEVLRHQGRPFIDDLNYSRFPDGESLIRAFNRFLDPIDVDQAGIGDVLCFVIKGKPRHAGIITEVGFIHAYSSIVVKPLRARDRQEKGKVTEQRLAERWRRRICRAYRYPGVDA